MPCFCLSLAPIVKVSSPMQEKVSKRGIFNPYQCNTVALTSIFPSHGTPTPGCFVDTLSVVFLFWSVACGFYI